LKTIVCGILFELLLVCVFAGAFSIQSARATAETADTDWWPMFMHDLNHTGTSTSTGPTTNQTLWNYPTGRPVESSSPAVVGGFVYVGSYDGNVYCLNAANGSQVWSYMVGDFVDSSPAVVNGVVYVGAGDYRIHAFGLPSAVIPEFPLGLFLSLFIMTTSLAAFVFLKREAKNKNIIKPTTLAH